MATVYIPVSPLGAIPAATSAATLTTVLLASAHPVPGLAFDAAGDEAVLFQLDLRNYGSGNLTFAMDWTSPTANSAQVIWGADFLAYTPTTDSGALSAQSFATNQIVTAAHAGTNPQRVMRSSLTISVSALSNDDIVWVRFYRDADNGTDTMPGDAVFIGGTFSYSDT